SDRNLKPGDVIEIFRDGYQHWAIYVGDGYVIHLVTACEVFCLFVITLKKEKLQDVAGNDKYRINNHLDDTYEPRPIEDILQEAERFHCATLVRYGNPQSKQVQFSMTLHTELYCTHKCLKITEVQTVLWQNV
uniref:LRAT domain-containing protein n=1 Tax=Cyprinus carpio TaxID=7962 RepID=A0A8C1LI72_CYPCA